MAFNLLIHSINEANGSSVFTDSGVNNVVITKVSDPTHSTSYAKFDTSSIWVDGDDGLQLPAGFYPFGQAFTIDFWLRFGATPGVHGRVFYTDYNALRARPGIMIGFYPDTSILRFFSAGTDASNWTCVQSTLMGAISTTEFVHHAIVLDGSYAYGYRNGVLQAKTTQNGWPYNGSSDVPCFGRQSSGYGVNCYYEEIAIRSGIIWDGSGYNVGDTVFTPPTAPYKTINKSTIQPAFPLGAGRMIHTLGR